MRSLLAICGSIIALLGVVMAIGSAFSALDGGDFFLFAGFGLIVSGALLAKRHAAGSLDLHGRLCGHAGLVAS